MTLLDFARGPALQWTLVIFVIGVLWRLVGVALLRTRPDLSEPRSRASWKGLRLIVRRSWPRREFLEGTAFNKVMAGAFHLGIFVALLFYLPHVLFFEDLFKGMLGGNLEQLIGLRWPTLPAGAVAFFSAVAIAALVALLVHRLTSPVKRLISNFNDYFSWFVTIAPLVTGLLAYAHAAGVPYETLLAVHILSAELLLLWFPFGKLMHTFFIFAARGSTGMLFERKGASL